MPRTVRYRSPREQVTSTSEDSDIVVALFRTCAIIAFYSVPIVTHQRVSTLTQAVALVASLFTLGLFVAILVTTRFGSQRLRAAWGSRRVVGSLLRRRVALQRVAALALDAALLTCIARDIYPPWSLQVVEAPSFVAGSDRLLPAFYLLTAVGALWFHRSGGLVTALIAAACWAHVAGSGSAFGAQSFAWAEAQRVAWTHGPVLLLQGFVIGCVAQARDAEHVTASRLQQELVVARRLQQAMLPDELPVAEGYDVGVRLRTAEAVGGDYHDLLLLDDGRLVICVADISGKSVNGFVYLSLLRSHLHVAAAAGLPPAEVAGRVNAVLAAVMHPESFVSMFLAVIEVPTGTVRYVNCGHPPPLLLPPAGGGEMAQLHTGDIVLGVLEAASFREGTTALPPGAMLVCFTDGVPEARNARWREFGTDRVVSAVRGAADNSAQAIADRVLAATDEFGADPKWDDATVLVLKRLVRSEPPR